MDVAPTRTPVQWQCSRPRRQPCSRSATTLMSVYCEHWRACVMLRNGTPSLQARAATPEIWCSRPDTSAQAEQHPTQTAMQQECYNIHVCVLQAFEGVCHAKDNGTPLLQARAATPEIWCSRPDTSALAVQQATQAAMQQEWFERSAPLRTAIVRQQVFFPDRRLIQFDCGKLQASPSCLPAHPCDDSKGQAIISLTEFWHLLLRNCGSCADQCPSRHLPSMM